MDDRAEQEDESEPISYKLDKETNHETHDFVMQLGSRAHGSACDCKRRQQRESWSDSDGCSMLIVWCRLVLCGIEQLPQLALFHTFCQEAVELAP